MVGLPKRAEYMKKQKRTHPGRQPVLLDREASPIVKQIAVDQDRSMNYVASKAVKEYAKGRLA